MATYYLKKTLTTNGNSYSLNGTDAQVDFDEGIEYFEDAYTKTLSDWAMPYPGATQTSNAPARKAVDIKDLKRTIKLRGNLANDSTDITGLSGTTATALNKKKALLAMIEQGGQCSLGVDGEEHTVHILGMKFTKVDFSDLTALSSEAVYSFEADFVIAEDQ